MPITADPWPLQTCLEFAALPTAPACARGHVRMVAYEWGLSALADPAAVPVIRLRMTSDRQSLVIHVWDTCDDMPVRQDASPDEIGGRGLLLVETLGKDWGAYREAEGKVVWVLISLSGPP
jgi:hypothetical protein